jgi:hypothetical protein
MGLSEEDQVRCPKSGYSIDMILHDSGRGMEGERSRSTGTWAVEFDGPSHFFTSRAPTGGTLASGAAGPRPRPRALLGVGRVQRGRPFACAHSRTVD